MNRVYINIAIEDDLSDAVVRKILQQSNNSIEIRHPYAQRGFGYLKKNIRSFNHAAGITPFLVLTDLDTAQCPPSLIKEWLPCKKHPNLIFRVAVREVEAWLMADRNNFARYLGIAKERIPLDAESIEDPKRRLIELAKKSRKRYIRESIVPSSKSGARQGPDYNGALIAFVNKSWVIEAAVENSISLKKTVKAVKDFKPVNSRT